LDISIEMSNQIIWLVAYM